MTQREEAEFLRELFESPVKEGKSKDYIYQLAKKHGLRPFQAENIRSFYVRNEGKVKVCMGLPCNLKGNGSRSIPLDMYPDNEVEEVSCLGYCDRAPVVWSKGTYFQVVNGRTDELDVQSSGKDFKTTGTLEEYVESGGFEVLKSLLNGGIRTDVLSLVDEFKLKGFGGSGFPAYVKWKSVKASEEDEKYLLVNAHEGEPGTFKDRILLEANPYDLIEAALIAARTVGATHILIALKYEYLNAEKALNYALETSAKYLGDIMGGKSLPDVTIRRIPGYYITGEESALMEAIEGRRSEPRLRPPYPAEIGLYGKPTLIDNVETLTYFLGRMREYQKNGTGAVGEKSYCLTGDVKNPGTYRLPYGTSSTILLTEKGGTKLSELKAVLPGGLSGGILPADEAEINLDFESVVKAGAGMGTGAMIAVSKDRCMVDVMSSVEGFFEKESCGKCMPCRYGTQELSALFINLKNGKATQAEIESANKTAEVMLKGSICGLGQASARMFMDAIKHYSGEISEHTKGNCPAGVCTKGAE